MVLEINESEFNEKVKGKCLVDFFTTWCGPCKMLSQVIDEVSKEIEGVSFYKIDVDENEEIGSEFNIMSVPTLILFEDGKQIKRTSGFISKEKLKEFII